MEKYLDKNSVLRLLKGVKTQMDKSKTSILYTKGAANGIASLDEKGNVPLSQLGNLDTDIYEVAPTFPGHLTEKQSKHIFLIPRDSDETTKNVYKEYIFVGNDITNVKDTDWEQLGEFTTSVDLKNYSKKNETVTSISITGEDSSGSFSLYSQNLRIDAADGTYKVVDIPLAKAGLINSVRPNPGKNGFMSANDKRKLDNIDLDALTTSINSANTAADNTNKAIKAAETATEGAEKVNATLTSATFIVTDRTGAKKQLELITNAKALEVEADVNRVKESLGVYSDRPNITLTAKENNVAISADGVKVTKSGWAIAEFTASKGDEYLFKPNVIDGSVCIFAERIDKVETRSIDYSYTYNEDGSVATATATYLGKTHVYNYAYSTESEGTEQQVTITENGQIVNALPYQYQTEVGAYYPLVRLNADAELPVDGYCRFVSHFKGNTSLKVAVTYKVGVADLSMKVVRDGLTASVSTQLGSVAQQISETRGVISQMDEEHCKRLSALEQAVGDLGGTVDRYYIGSQDTTKASSDIVEASTNVGKQMLQDMYRPFLINHEDAKEGVEVMPAKELKRNNVLRFKDNSFAPAVGITEEMRAQCDVELYLDAEHTQKYCDAGAFDAEKFYNDYGFTQKLYDASGNEIEHVLRPWETTSKNYSIKVGDPTVNYLLDDYPASEPDTLYRGILKSYREYKGMKPNKLAPTLISPCCDTSIKDVDGKIKFRSFFFLYNPCDNNTKGSLGSSGLNMFYDNGAYPRVNDVNQVTSMDYARNNNFDKTKTYPFAEMGFHSYNTFVCAHELLYGTNYINDPDNLFSSGTSSDDSCNNEAAWNKYGGVRIKMGDGDWKYLVYAQTSDLLYKDANGTKMADNMSIFVNTEYPKWRCNEALIALSFAVEMGVPENTEFEVYGTKYWYVTPPKVKGIADGYLNARVYRKVAGEWQGYDASGNAQVFTVEVVLRDGLIDGVSTSGDIFHYRGGGYEQVAEVLVQQSESRVGYPTDLYIETDQRKWHSERAQSKTNKGVFDFESQYKNVGRQESTQTGWLKKRCGNTLMEAIAGGGSNSYAAAFNDNSNYFSNTVGDRVRKSVRGGGTATWSTGASRSLYATYSVLSTRRSTGGSAQVLFQCK